MLLRRTSRIGAMAMVAALVAYSVGHADSPFPATQNPPVIFSGSLSSSGVPLSGSHQIALNLWQSTDTSVSSNQLCQGSPQTIDVTAGQFQIELDAACVSVFSHSTKVWYELVVDGTSFPLQPVGSAPFAVRTTREFSNGTRLAQPRNVLYGEDGYRGDPYALPIQDTLRNEPCYPTATTEGITRCLPNAERGYMGDGQAINPYGTYSDSSCTQPAPTDGIRYHYHNISSPPPTVSPYVVDIDPTGAISAIYPATGRAVALYVWGTSSCQPFMSGYYVFEYTLGPPIPLSEFVQVQTVAE